MNQLWIPVADYQIFVTSQRLNLITGGNTEELLLEAETYAIAFIKDNLNARFDMDAVFAGSSSLYPVVKIWVQHIVMHFVWQRVPDKLTPERVQDNYDEVVKRILQIEDGKASTLLPVRTTPAGVNKSKFRWGSNPRRSH